jgi:hypothetical protein
MGMRAACAPRTRVRTRCGGRHRATSSAANFVDGFAARVLATALRAAVFVLALMVAVLGTTSLSPAADDGRCLRLGEMMRAIAKARDAGLSRSEAYDVVRDATPDARMRLVARIAVDAAYDCTTCSPDLLEGTMVGYCKAQRPDHPAPPKDGRWL